MKIIPLKEGNFAVSKSKEFTTLKEDSEISYLSMAIQPFLIITHNDYILFDAGLGLNISGIPIIHKCLEKENIRPEQITKVLLSHLHKDHIDGIGQLSNGKLTSNFPNAKIYLQKRELEYALKEINNPSFNFEILEKLTALQNLEFLSDDNGKITDEITYEVSGGHTPFHQVFWIKENDQIIFYGADDLPQRSYLKFHIAYKTDFNGKKASLLRQEWEKQAKIENWTILLYHDIKKPILQL